ncbi:MAG: hypothetical protein JOZ62_22730, partial [Acidobacteriaceae bacterium]|nr:hypothetical protein [Acidobacteriaceae bacterium]
MTRLASLIVTLLVPLWCFSAPLDVNQLFVFGDSLSDVGNTNTLTLGFSPGSNYDHGRYTDGPDTNPATRGPFGVWVEQLAPKLNVPVPASSLNGGTDYAFGGADTAGGVLIPSVASQVQTFLGDHPAAPSHALYTFWAGANDIADGMNPLTAANNIESDIRILSAAGAKYFVWLNLPPLGYTPDAIAAGDSALATEASNAFNLEWQTDI